MFLVTWWDDGCPSDNTHLRDLCSYILANPEISPKTQRPHWQTCLVLKKRMKKSTLIKLLHRVCTAHPHVVAVSSKSSGYAKARNYCRKERTRVEGGLPVEWGQWPFEADHRQGKRTDISGALAFARANPLAGPLEFADAGFGEEWLKFSRLSVVQAVCAAEVEVKQPLAYWFYGDPETGKTLRAYEFCKKLCAKNKWRFWTRDNHFDPRFDGYANQEIILWDEFREVAPHQDLGALIKILQRGRAVRKDVKYAGVYLTARVHVFTSPRHPSEMFSLGVGQHQGSIEQLLRRLRNPDGTERIYTFKNKCKYHGPADDNEDVGADAVLAEVMEDYPDVPQ